MEFMFGIPGRTHFGPGVAGKVGSIAAGLGASRAFIVCDKGVRGAGLVDRIVASLNEAGLQSQIFDDVEPNPTDAIVEAAADKALVYAAGVIVAIGGGSAIDTAKAMNVLLTNPWPITRYEGFNKVEHPGRPLIAIPTTAGTASEVTEASIITDTRRVRKMVLAGAHLGATVALADPLLTLGLPQAITAATGMDALTHAIEAYVSKAATPPTDALAIEAVSLISAHITRAFENGQDLEARSKMMLGSLMAGYAFNSALLGLTHSIAHPLSAHFHLPHGVANAIALPWVMAFNAESSPARFAAIARAMGLRETSFTDAQSAAWAVDQVRMLNRALQMPRLSACHVPRDSFIRLAEDALLEVSTLFNPRAACR